MTRLSPFSPPIRLDSEQARLHGLYKWNRANRHPQRARPSQKRESARGTENESSSLSRINRRRKISNQISYALRSPGDQNVLSPHSQLHVPETYGALLEDLLRAESAIVSAALRDAGCDVYIEGVNNGMPVFSADGDTVTLPELLRNASRLQHINRSQGIGTRTLLRGLLTKWLSGGGEMPDVLTPESYTYMLVSGDGVVVTPISSRPRGNQKELDTIRSLED